MKARRIAFPICGTEPVVPIHQISQSKEGKISMHLHIPLYPNL